MMQDDCSDVVDMGLWDMDRFAGEGTFYISINLHAARVGQFGQVGICTGAGVRVLRSLGSGIYA